MCRLHTWVCVLCAFVFQFQWRTSVLFSGLSKLLHFYLFRDELQILPAKATGIFCPCPALINLLLQVSGFWLGCGLYTKVSNPCSVLVCFPVFSGVPRYSSQAGANFCAFTVFLLGASDSASHAKGLPTTVTLPLPSPSSIQCLPTGNIGIHMYYALAL